MADTTSLGLVITNVILTCLIALVLFLCDQLKTQLAREGKLPPSLRPLPPTPREMGSAPSLEAPIAAWPIEATTHLTPQSAASARDDSLLRRDDGGVGRRGEYASVRQSSPAPFV